MDPNAKIRALEGRLLNVEQVIKSLQTWVTSISDKIGEEIPNIFRIQNDAEISNLFPPEDEFNEPSEDSFQDMVNEDVKPEMEELNPYKLKDCTVVLERLSESTLEAHLREPALTQKVYSCPACPKVFISRSALKTHQQQHNPKSKAYSCTFCHKVYYYRHLLTAHIRSSHTQKDRYLTTCPVPGCNIRRSTRSLINHHIEKIHPDQVHLKFEIIPRSRLIIGDAGSVRVVSVTRKEHSKKTSRFRDKREGVKYPHQCPDCNFSYKNKNKLEIHQEQIHRRSSEHPCPHCSKIYYHPRLLNHHINLSHVFSRRYPCPVQSCPYITTNKSSARKHLRKVHPELTHLEPQIKVSVSRKNPIESGGLEINDFDPKSQEMEEKNEPTFENPGIEPPAKPKAKIIDNTHKHRTGRIFCPIPNCSYSQTHKDQLNRHIDKAHPGQGHLKFNVLRRAPRKGKKRCPEPGCEEEYILKAELKLHQKIHAKVEEVEESRIYAGGQVKNKCPILGCPVKRFKKDELNKHIDKAHPGQDHLKFKIRKRIRRSGPKWSCPEPGCGEEFILKAELILHQKLHSKPEEVVSLPCEYCGILYKKESALQNHIRVKHENPEESIEKYTCPEEGCGKEFGMKEYLKRHMQTHSDLRYTCEYCGVSYRQNQGLQVHLRHKHTENPEFRICPVCGLKLKTTSYSVHMHSHSGATYSCEYCSKSFGMKSRRDFHQKCHLMPPEVCKICGVLKSKYRMMEHMRKVHSGSRFECQEEGCDKLFKTRSGLKRHKMRFH